MATATETTIPAVWDIREAAHEAGATTTHVLDAIAWTAARHAADFVTKDWEFRLQRAAENVRNQAHGRIIHHAEDHSFDLDNGFTFDELPEVFAAHATLFAMLAAADWRNKLDQLAY
ncbi:hypothetical protein ACQP25_16820 [Microtetraspora malaysiensis]|uniref:hypothetical protein n=1 Tax=Microtetraspora malaysiensis TaxID=161358 RepID=UPI003D8E5323